MSVLYQGQNLMSSESMRITTHVDFFGLILMNIHPFYSVQVTLLYNRQNEILLIACNYFLDRKITCNDKLLLMKKCLLHVSIGRHLSSHLESQELNIQVCHTFSKESFFILSSLKGQSQ